MTSWSPNNLNTSELFGCSSLSRQTNELSKLGGISKKSVRLDSRIPRDLKERLEQIANICNLVAEYFAAVPEHQKFTVYATMVDMQNKWGNNDLKIDLEILKMELNNDTAENDVVIDVKFIDTDEENEDI